MKIYKHGCLTCGVDSIYIRKIRHYCFDNNIELDIFNSKYDSSAREWHATYLSVSDLPTDSYTPIVVDRDSVTPLRLWKP